MTSLTDAPPSGPTSLPPVREASSILLLREGVAGAGVQVFLVRRASQAVFLADTWVFPGGRVDAGDRSPALLARCRGLDQLRLPETSPVEAAGYAIAALRELLEEGGVLLAEGPDGPPDAKTVKACREGLAGGKSFLTVLEEAGLRLAVDGLQPLAWWLTPPGESRRFDTRFFLARLPAGQEGAHDEQETVAGRWMAPKEALEAFDQGHLLLAPPTWCMLHTLAESHDIEAILAQARQTVLVRVEPFPLILDGQVVLALPGDPLFPLERLPALPVRLPVTRLVRLDGRWIPHRAQSQEA